MMVTVLDSEVADFWCGLWLPWKMIFVYVIIVEFVFIVESVFDQNTASIGLETVCMEKYIRRHMDLSVVSFEIMLRKIQEEIKEGSQ